MCADKDWPGLINLIRCSNCGPCLNESCSPKLTLRKEVVSSGDLSVYETLRGKWSFVSIIPTRAFGEKKTYV